MSLIPNPIGEMLQPLLRVEEAIITLTRQLKPVNTLPSVQEELVTINATLLLMLDELRGLREEVVELVEVPVAARKKPRAVAR